MIPRPTYWPAALALGSVLILWGVIASPAISIVGAVLFFVAAGGWVKELIRE